MLAPWICLGISGCTPEMEEAHSGEDGRRYRVFHPQIDATVAHTEAHTDQFINVRFTVKILQFMDRNSATAASIPLGRVITIGIAADIGWICRSVT
jgi:hypothetical protein